jgi:hypothetical protein
VLAPLSKRRYGVPRRGCGTPGDIPAPSSRGLGRRPLKAVTPVRIRSGLLGLEGPCSRKARAGTLVVYTGGTTPRNPPAAGAPPPRRGRCLRVGTKVPAYGRREQGPLSSTPGRPPGAPGCGASPRKGWMCCASGTRSLPAEGASRGLGLQSRLEPRHRGSEPAAGHPLTRPRLPGFRPASAVTVGAVPRGSYHPHQGAGATPQFMY